MKNNMNYQRSRLITIHQTGASCSLCEAENIDSGTIYKGQCICRSCLGLIRGMQAELTARAAEACSPYAR
ncbi:MAG: hypothetical protein ACI4VM_08940 [Anaerovoracaceae bacterium]